MKRLCELVDIAVNNEACVVFTPKKDTRMDFISLGCFNGNEEMIRMTKGRTPEITVFYKDGSNFSYHFGEGSTTVISGSYPRQREMIRECAILDFGIVCDWAHHPQDIDYQQMAKDTMGVRSMEDAVRSVTLVSGGSMVGHIRINEQTLGRDVHVQDISKWFLKRGYEVEFAYGPLTNGLPCGKVYGHCVPIEEHVAAKAPRELSDNKLVRYVQERLDCDAEIANEFISCFHAASLAEDGENMLAFYEDAIAEAGLCVKNLSDEELASLGASVERALLDDTGDKECSAVLKWLKEHKGKSVDGIISDANQRAADARGKTEVDFEKEM